MNYSIRSLKRLISQSTNKRISKDSTKELDKILKDYALVRLSSVNENLKSETRVTLKKRDLENARNISVSRKIEKDIKHAPTRRLVDNLTDKKRVSNEFVKEFRRELSALANEVIELADKLATRRKSKTIQEKDFKRSYDLLGVKK